MSKTFHKLKSIASRSVNASRIMTFGEVKSLIEFTKHTSISCMKDSLSRTIFFPTRHGFGYPHLPKGFVPMTISIPSNPDPSVNFNIGIEEGYTVANNLEELAAVLDKFYPEFGHVKSDTPNWQPEHFPAGTVVELKNYFHDTETGVIVHSDRNGTLKPLWVTVTAVAKNGIDSYCIVTDKMSPVWGIGFDSYNFSHVGRILSRGEGSLVWDKEVREAYFEKNNLSLRSLKKDHYYWSDIRTLMPHILSSIPGAKNKLLKDTFIRQINEQSFVKKVTLFAFYEIKHAPKKKLREFVRKNWNRWLMTAKEIQQTQLDYDIEMARSMDEFTSNWEEEGSSNIDKNETMYEHSH